MTYSIHKTTGNWWIVADGRPVIHTNCTVVYASNAVAIACLSKEQADEVIKQLETLGYEE